jgi:gluconate kinase
MACSDANQINQGHIVVFLEGSKQLLQERMAKRNKHFMQLTLLDSQLETFEQLDNSSCSLHIDIEKSVEEITNEIIKRINDILKSK